MLFKINDSVFRIRKCTDDDYRFVYALLKKNMYALFVRHWGWDPKRIRKDFKKENIKIVEYKNRRIGFIDLEPRGQQFHLNNIQISASMQGRGLGTALMKLIECDVMASQVRKINLKVFKDNPARNLYVRLGYEQVSDEGGAVVMEKRLRVFRR